MSKTSSRRVGHERLVHARHPEQQRRVVREVVDGLLVDLEGEERLLIDYLMLVRVGGGWRVVSRVFTPFDL